MQSQIDQLLPDNQGTELSQDERAQIPDLLT